MSTNILCLFILLMYGSFCMADSTIRIATFNASLNQCRVVDGLCLEGELINDLSNGRDRKASRIAELIQRIDPDIILLNEFNYDSMGTAADLFQLNYLSIGQNLSRSDEPGSPIEFPFRFLAPSNTGIHSGFDLDNDGHISGDVGSADYGNDAFGFGEFPGRYGMLLLSKYPIAMEQSRTFQNFLWKDMPDALLPDQRRTPETGDWYSNEELAKLPLSSKSHWDVPIRVDGRTVHVLASHPTPPVFDGSEDRNGKRNHDEIRFWNDYISGSDGDYIVDDRGAAGPLPADASFVITGDLNSDPDRGDSLQEAIRNLLDNPRVNTSLTPVTHTGSDITSTFNLRVDYVLPSRDLEMTSATVFSAESLDPLRRLLNASDHRPVWVDVQFVPEPMHTPWCVAIPFAMCLTRGRRILSAST